jgi:CheY-like chemotaxis protein
LQTREAVVASGQNLARPGRSSARPGVGTGGAVRVAIIVMIANAMRGDREACLDAGMDGYVPKAVKRDVLFAEMDRLLKGVRNGATTV